ncbi:hypothetical protein A3715_10635 [Oleiphilus sp. HI0009]|nr:hypothetical protein A3715_10635 [Oleiphilus sp. HI0009]
MNNKSVENSYLTAEEAFNEMPNICKEKAYKKLSYWYEQLLVNLIDSKGDGINSTIEIEEGVRLKANHISTLNAKNKRGELVFSPFAVRLLITLYKGGVFETNGYSNGDNFKVSDRLNEYSQLKVNGNRASKEIKQIRSRKEAELARIKATQTPMKALK